MDRSSFLVWWLLAVPIVIAVVDRMMMGSTRTSGPTGADGYIERENVRLSRDTASGTVARSL